MQNSNMALPTQSQQFKNVFPTPLSVAVQVSIVVVLAVLLSPTSAEHVMKVYSGKRAGGGSVTERVLSTGGDDYEVLNITVEFKNGSAIYATRTFDLKDTISLCFYQRIRSNADATNCFSIDSQTGRATSFTRHSFEDWIPMKDPSATLGMERIENTTDGINFIVVEETLGPYFFDSWMYSYRFNGTSLVRNSSYATTLDSKQLKAQNQIKRAFTKGWSAVSFLTSGVLAHGPRGLYVTDGKGGSANLTDAAGVPLNLVGPPSLAPSKGSSAEGSGHTLALALLLLISTCASFLAL